VQGLTSERHRPQDLRTVDVALLADERVPVQPRLDGAYYPVSSAPGLGVEVNEELVKQQSFKFWEAPHLKRRDGSVTNW